MPGITRGGKKKQQKKRYFFENMSVVEVKRLCVSVVFFFFPSFFFLGCCSLDPYWKHAFVSGKTDKCLAAFYWSSSYTRSQRLKEQTVNYRLCRSGVVLSCWHDISTHSAFILLTMIILFIVTIFKRIYLFFLSKKAQSYACFQPSVFTEMFPVDLFKCKKFGST